MLVGLLYTVSTIFATEMNKKIAQFWIGFLLHFAQFAILQIETESHVAYFTIDYRRSRYMVTAATPAIAAAIANTRLSVFNTEFLASGLRPIEMMPL